MDILDQELLKAIRPAARRIAVAGIEAADHEIARLFPQGGYVLAYEGGDLWKVQAGELTYRCSSLDFALRAARDLAQDIKRAASPKRRSAGIARAVRAKGRLARSI